MFKSIINNLSIFVEKTLILFVVLGLSFPPHAFSAQIAIGTTMNFRTEVHGSNGKSVLYAQHFSLPKGTVLEIPDEYAPRDNSFAAKNEALNRWIKEAGLTQREYDDNGVSRYDYFFPIKIYSMPGSNNYNDQVGYVALKYLATNDKLQLKTIAEAPTYSTTPAPQTQKKKSTPAPVPVATPNRSSIRTVRTRSSPRTQDGDTSARILQPRTSSPSTSKTESTVCINCETNSDIIKKIRNDLAPTLAKLQEKKNQFLSGHQKNFEGLKRNFNNSCFGLNFDDFSKALISEASKENIPPEILLGIMTQESAGKCTAIGDKTSTSKSVGLFQINPSLTDIKQTKFCSSSQLQSLKGKSVEELSTNPNLQCLENPIVNLKKGIQVLKSKFKIVNGDKPREGGPWNNLSNEQKDLYRKALSAYNGGQAYVIQAYKDMDSVATKYGITLNNDDWESRRLFMFRRVLQNNGYIGTGRYNRSLENSIANMAYVEGIAGRNSSPSEDSFVERWAKSLYRSDDSISVASRER